MSKHICELLRETPEKCVGIEVKKPPWGRGEGTWGGTPQALFSQYSATDGRLSLVARRFWMRKKGWGNRDVG